MTRYVCGFEAGDNIKPIYLLQAYEGTLSSWSSKGGLAREFVWAMTSPAASR